ncbi:MAG: tRNA (adenosine(37)-N6)-threonylcarbamoyltransferase complex dimerization subunit type 1 TsaB [Eubacterium sp.]|nr:tRNA (adenosine(37)-N6)-threonylcarbamoyltransferase complex dimerization subunit type 1 TsaB [Eubacterium sp.]
MKVLGIDSSGLVASVALVEDDNLLAEYTVNYKKTHSQTLLPMLEEIQKMTELDMESIDAIAVAAGPGSFTGLRIGSATAKGLGLALEKPLVAVPTVGALAYNLVGHRDYICPLMDARRNQAYTGLYCFDGNEMTELQQPVAAGIDKVVEDINRRGEVVCFLGDGVTAFHEYLEENLRVPYTFAPAHMNKQRAGSVAALGLVMAKAGKTVSSDEFAPEYLRLSQAERERLAKEGKKA